MKNCCEACFQFLFRRKKIQQDGDIQQYNTEEQNFNDDSLTAAEEQLNLSHSDFIFEKENSIGDDYTLLNPAIAKTFYSEVIRAIQKSTKIIRALKIIKKADIINNHEQQLISEVEVLKKLDHPHICKIQEFYQDDKNIYIVNEYLQGGELFEKIVEEGQFTEQKSAKIMKQLLSAIAFCHEKQIIHRDLKPTDILFVSQDPNSDIKIIDFGMSKRLNVKQDQKDNHGGEPYYIAPEIVMNSKVNEKCDIWSCGVILYILLCGYPPFNGENEQIILEKVGEGKFSFDGNEWQKISEEAKQLISQMLEYDPEKRISAREAMNHQWIQKNFNQSSQEMNKIQKALKNMQQFKCNSTLSSILWIFMTKYFTSREEEQDLLLTFKTLDQDCDGKITKVEFLSAFQKYTYLQLDEIQTVEEVFNLVDRDKKGYITFTDFVTASMNRESLLQEQRLLVAFNMIDKQNSGKITLQQLQKQFGKKIKDQTWGKIMKEVGGQNSSVTYDIFKAIMQKQIKK